LGSDSPKYSFRGKCECKIDKTMVPGPGQYITKIQINPEGKFPVSNIKNITKIFISAKKSDPIKSKK
jgi:hypothetical protein